MEKLKGSCILYSLQLVHDNYDALDFHILHCAKNYKHTATWYETIRCQTSREPVVFLVAEVAF